ncbi:unnamed protein product [Brassica oleracea var. botrytis]
MDWPGLLRVMVHTLSAPTRRKKKTKSVVNTPGLRKHSYSLRSGEGMDVSEEVNNVPTPSYAGIEMRGVNEDANAVSPRFHRADAVEMQGIFASIPRNDATSPVKPCNAVIMYQEPVFVLPQRYVSPQNMLSCLCKNFSVSSAILMINMEVLTTFMHVAVKKKKQHSC